MAVQWAVAPQRIVSLLPSLTEAICALGQCAGLVGVVRYSNWPAAVTALPQVSGGLDPNIEAIVALRPDVVFLSQSSRNTPRLEALGLKVFALETQTHADVKRVLQKVAQVLSVDPAQTQRLWESIEQGVLSAAQLLPPSTQQVRVYIEINRAPFAAGTTSFIGETLARLGAKNILPESLGPFPAINAEFVVRAQPDLIMVNQADLADMLLRPGWSEIPAVKNQRICAFEAGDQTILVRPGPRIPEAAHLMVECLKRFAP